MLLDFSILISACKEPQHFSNIFTKTLFTEGPEVGDLRVVTTGAHTLDVTWISNTDYGQVEIFMASDFPKKIEQHSVANVSASTSEYTFKDLTPAGLYEVKVLQYFDGNPGESSDSGNVTS